MGDGRRVELGCKADPATQALLQQSILLRKLVLRAGKISIIGSKAIDIASSKQLEKNGNSKTNKPVI